jgi:hypothetical protein
MPFFIVICLICVQASPLGHPTKSLFSVLLIAAPENAQPRITLPTLCVGDSPVPTYRVASDGCWAPLDEIL